MTVADLKEGDDFKWRSTQKDFRTVKKIISVPESPAMPESYKGCLIIVLTNCKCVTLHPSTEIFKKEHLCTAS